VNTEELLKSGKLELYVAGALCGKEAREVAAMVKEHPELQKEVQAIEAALLATLNESSVAPSPELKGKVMAAISNQMQVAGTEKSISNTVENTGAKVIAMNPANRWLAAASVALFIALGATYFILNEQIGKQRAEITALNDKYITQTAADKRYADELALINHHLTKKIVLNGVAGEPNARAIVYWNTLNKRVIVSPTDLPAPPEGKQYQLWAMVDGKPVDAGVFDVTSDSIKLDEVKKIDNAQAFAITLEQKGGVPSPTLSAMYVMGSI